MHMKLAKKIFYRLSKIAVINVVEQNDKLSNMWRLSLRVLPILDDHFVTVNLHEEECLRLRFLICSEVVFLKDVITALREKEVKINSYLDVGDSDGSTRLLLKESMSSDISTLGINLQPSAVEKIRQKGLEAECIDAMKLNEKGRRYDIVSVFETLEHLPNPVGFLENIHEIVNHRLIVSVPYIIRSRVGLGYLGDKWPADKIPTVENNHIFELTPEDWRKIFLHCGWGVEKECIVRQFPERGILGHIMKYAWRKISFEGFWFVSLQKDNTYRKNFRIE